jgi:hypothetical protein
MLRARYPADQLTEEHEILKFEAEAAWVQNDLLCLHSGQRVQHSKLPRTDPSVSAIRARQMRLCFNEGIS